MRVIAGSKRGMKLNGFEGNSIRPTTDRVKENIFNIISGYLLGACVADLFSGTGAMAIEAISRGAKQAVLCDVSEKSLKIINSNILKTGVGSIATVIKKDALSFLKSNTQKFDIIFLDPPYNKGLGQKAINLIGETGALSNDGIVVLERAADENVAKTDSLKLSIQKKYGSTCIDIYKAIRG